MVERATIQRTSDGIYAAWNANDADAVGASYNEVDKASLLSQLGVE